MRRSYWMLASMAGAAAGCASPVAVDDTAVAPQASTINIDVLANDTNPREAPLQVKKAWGAGKGTVVINPDNSIAYSPNPNTSGTDIFHYRIRDNQNRGSAAKVVVDIVPPAPPPAYTRTEVDAFRVREITPVEPTERDVFVVVPRDRHFASPEPDGAFLAEPARTTGPFIESVLIVLHTTSDDKNREEPVRLVVRRGNEIVADRTVGAGDLWGSFTTNTFELMLEPMPPIADASRMALDIRKIPVGGGGEGGGWVMQTEARARLSDGSVVTILPMSDPTKLGDGAPGDRSWTLAPPR